MKKILLILLLIITLILPISCDETSPVYVGSFLGDDGTYHELSFIDGMYQVSSQDYLYSIAEGDIAGHEPWAKTGYNPNIGVTEEDMWGISTSYVFPTAEIQMEVVSSDNTQDLPGGTGALTVYIGYLDASYAEHSTTVILNGTTPVNTAVNNIFRVNNFRVSSTGTGGKAVGNLSLRSVGGAVTYSFIQAGYTRARNICYTVPDGKTLFVTTIAFSCTDAAKGVRFTTRATYDNVCGCSLTPGIFFMAYNEVELQNTAYVRQLDMPTKLPEHTDIKVSVISAQAGAIGTCSLSGWLEVN